MPFQCSTTGTPGELMSWLPQPTAQASAGPVASTASSNSVGSTVGDEDIRQVPLVRWRISAVRLDDEPGAMYEPTAHTAPPAAATPVRSLKPDGLPFGVGSGDQVEPFQWATSVLERANPG